MSSRVSFADLLRVGADKDKQKIILKLAPTASPPILKTVAPENDFNKRANSLERDALPKGLFPGASKAIYDALYLRTLGAINSTNTIQATRKQIINWSGVKNIKTVNAHLKKLEENGFIRRSNFNGEHSGNYYEVYLPDQVNLSEKILQIDQTQTRHRPDPDQTQTSTKNWSGSGLGNSIENKRLSHLPLKTKNKTKSDDEPAALNKSDNDFFLDDGLGLGLVGILESEGRFSLSDSNLGIVEKSINEISKKLIGKELKFADNRKLEELAEILVMELEIAAARTNAISNVPAFLTEHLRRRLSGKPNVQSENRISGAKIDSKSLADGKNTSPIQNEVETYQAEPLTAQAKETVLKTMREYVEKGHREFVASLRDTYTAEDWKWLSEKLFGEAEKNDKDTGK